MDDADEPRMQDSEAARAKDDFVKAKFEKGADFWENLATFVYNELKYLGKGDPIVDATYNYRVKTEKSLQDKIKKMQRSGKCQTLESIQNIRWDIAGTRVCLYFPSQVTQVRSFIEQHKLFEVIPHNSNQPAKPFRERAHKMSDQDTGPYEERMGYYEADHYWIRLRKGESEVKEKLPEYDGEEIEIQVRLVLMDAWAEIRHDLEYKHILGYPGEDELRVLDAISQGIGSCSKNLEPNSLGSTRL